MDSMYYIGLDVHKKTISYCVKDAGGQIHDEGNGGMHTHGCEIGHLDADAAAAPDGGDGGDDLHRARFDDHLLPHAAGVKVAHPVMLRAIALAKKKNDCMDARRLPGTPLKVSDSRPS